jgi:hypothetical protein
MLNSWMCLSCMDAVPKLEATKHEVIDILCRYCAIWLRDYLGQRIYDLSAPTPQCGDIRGAPTVGDPVLQTSASTSWCSSP